MKRAEEVHHLAVRVQEIRPNLSDGDAVAIASILIDEGWADLFLHARPTVDDSAPSAGAMRAAAFINDRYMHRLEMGMDVVIDDDAETALLIERESGLKDAQRALHSAVAAATSALHKIELN